VFGDDLLEHGLDEDDAYSKESDDYGSTLSLSAVDEILDYARQRFEKSYLEMVWNFEVYYCLLEKVFRVGERPYLVDVILWYDAKLPLYTPTGNANTSTSHSATITKKYLPTTVRRKLSKVFGQNRRR
jgi:hypothetical protein